MNARQPHEAVSGPTPTTSSGWKALAEGRWEEARSRFAHDLVAEQTPEALEGLSWAAWWLNDAEGVFVAREGALRLYKALGDRASAARMATWLAADQLDFRGATSVANGWLRRARRLLEGIEPGPEHGWLAFHEGYIALGRGRTSMAHGLSTEAADIGRRFEVPDLEMLGLSLRGLILVICGDVDAGMSCLDEAAAAALEGAATVPISGAWTCCFLVTACEAVRDYPRAVEWCDRIRGFAERYGSSYMLGFCRAHYANVHLWRGDWKAAEADLVDAEDAYARSRPAAVVGVRVALAELRRRQGRWEEAEGLLSDTRGRASLLCLGHLALDRGQVARARRLAESALRRVPASNQLERTSPLELLLQVSCRTGALVDARGYLDELRETERIVGTRPLTAAVHLGAGRFAAASGDPESAVRHFDDALDGFEECGAPFEAGEARIEAATSLLALGRQVAAERELEKARAALLALGAAPAARRAQQALDLCSAEPTPVPLTRREREVVRLVAEGMTNRQIAGRLVVSEHTVHRHVTNILRKLDLPSRAAAAAYAVRYGLTAQ
jgi:DNA-binding CsgD family transcriptional regulator